MVVIRSTGRGRLHNGIPIQSNMGYSPLFAAKRANGGLPKFTISNIKRKTMGEELKNHQQKETMFIRCK